MHRSRLPWKNPPAGCRDLWISSVAVKAEPTCGGSQDGPVQARSPEEPGSSAHAGAQPSMASARTRRWEAIDRNSTRYSTCFPSRRLVTMPACLSVRRCRDTTLRSTADHDAISPTVVSDDPHEHSWASSWARVGSHRARKSSGSKNTSSTAHAVALSFVCVTAQMLRAPATQSSCFWDCARVGGVLRRGRSGIVEPWLGPTW